MNLIKLKGIDISTWQGDIDFKKVVEDGIDFVILRSSFRHTTDSKFFEYVEKCKEVGLRIAGVYHFSYALSVAQATSEARFCLEQVEKAGLTNLTDFTVFFDFEYDTVKKALNSGVTLGPDDCIAHTKAFCQYVQKKGYNAGVYTNIDYHDNWYGGQLPYNTSLWLADYSGDPDYNCLIQQYTNKGRVDGISGNVDMNYMYERIRDYEKVVDNMYSRQKVVDLAMSWLGKNEADGSYKEIIDIYNSYSGKLPRGTKMDYSWAWCAATWSALAIKLGYTEIMPIEISCGYLIEEAVKMGCWVEDDTYIPLPGDAILYDWDDNGVGDNIGWPDHVGVVVDVNTASGYEVVVEGNKNDAVGKRTISLNGIYIRGYITPNYGDSYVCTTPGMESGKSIDEVAHEVITGIWGNGEDRIRNLKLYGYDYDTVQSRVNEILNGSAVKGEDTSPNQPSNKKVVSTCYAECFNKNLAGTYRTTEDLYLRNDAGTNKKALCIIPQGTDVMCYGYYNDFNGVKWLYIQFIMDGVMYIGFSSSTYLKRK